MKLFVNCSSTNARLLALCQLTLLVLGLWTICVRAGDDSDSDFDEPPPPEQQFLDEYNRYQRIVYTTNEVNRAEFGQISEAISMMIVCLTNYKRSTRRPNIYIDYSWAKAETLRDICVKSRGDCRRKLKKIRELEMKLDKKKRNLALYIKTCKDRQKKFCS